MDTLFVFCYTIRSRGGQQPIIGCLFKIEQPGANCSEPVLLPNVVDNSDRPPSTWLTRVFTRIRCPSAFPGCLSGQLWPQSGARRHGSALNFPRLSQHQAALVRVAPSRVSAPSSGGWSARPPWPVSAADSVGADV